MLTSRYLVGCEIVTCSLLLFRPVEALRFTAHSLTQRLLFGLWLPFAWKWSTFHNASREIKDESLWSFCILFSVCFLAALTFESVFLCFSDALVPVVFQNFECFHVTFNDFLFFCQYPQSYFQQQQKKKVSVVLTYSLREHMQRYKTFDSITSIRSHVKGHTRFVTCCFCSIKQKQRQ